MSVILITLFVKEKQRDGKCKSKLVLLTCKK